MVIIPQTVGIYISDVHPWLWQFLPNPGHVGSFDTILAEVDGLL